MKLYYVFSDVVQITEDWKEYMRFDDPGDAEQFCLFDDMPSAEWKVEDLENGEWVALCRNFSVGVTIDEYFGFDETLARDTMERVKGDFALFYSTPEFRGTFWEARVYDIDDEDSNNLRVLKERVLQDPDFIVLERGKAY